MGRTEAGELVVPSTPRIERLRAWSRRGYELRAAAVLIGLVVAVAAIVGVQLGIAAFAFAGTAALVVCPLAFGVGSLFALPHHVLLAGRRRITGVLFEASVGFALSAAMAASLLASIGVYASLPELIAVAAFLQPLASVLWVAAGIGVAVQLLCSEPPAHGTDVPDLLRGRAGPTAGEAPTAR